MHEEVSKGYIYPAQTLLSLMLMKCRAMPRNLGSQRGERDNK